MERSFRVLIAAAAILLLASCLRFWAAEPSETDGDGDADSDGDVDGDGDADGDADADDPGDCDHEVCDFLPICGCPPGYGCHCIGGQECERQCAPAGAVPHGGACEQVADCVLGTACIQHDAEPANPALRGVCLRYCHSDIDCAGLGAGSLCQLALNVPEAHAMTVCSVDCNPLTNADCPEAYACFLGRRTTDSSEAYTHCWPAGPYGAPANCDHPNECDADHNCVYEFFEGAGFCLELCRPDSSPACVPPGMCDYFPEPFLVGDIEYGVCYR